MRYVTCIWKYTYWCMGRGTSFWSKGWTPLTDGIGATGGTDVNGPTALLKSVSHIPHARFTQGTQLNMKLEPSMLAR